MGENLSAPAEGSESLIKYIESLRLNRDVMDLMLRGRSVIDSHYGLHLRSVEVAGDFLDSYGYRLDNPVEIAETLGNYREALRFIKKYFLKPENADGADLEIPKIFFELNDVRHLFVWSSDKNQLVRAQWACAILRVMHGISHLDKDLRHEYFPEIQKQIFDRFYKEIHTADDRLYLGDPKFTHSVEILKFLTKPRKTRDSLILKLLHKRETLAEDVFDQIGVRFVAKSRIDIVRILRYLRDRYIVMPMNIRPSRSRNTLIDPRVYRRKWREVKHAVVKGEFHNRQWVEELLEKSLEHGYADGKEDAHEKNPFSSGSFQSIQFTCRQLIKYRNPLYDEVKAIRVLLKSRDEPELKNAFARLDLSQIVKEQKFFYPFEVQIYDRRAYEEAESGRASHSSYKAAQTKVAMKRVLGPLLD